MRPLRTFSVVPALPAELEPLREIAMNLRWAWHPPSEDLFRQLDPQGWVRSGRNPIRLLEIVEQEQLEQAAADAGYRAQLGEAHRDLRGYLADDATWFERGTTGGGGAQVAYFSAEFGITDCVKIFAGGLGMLAGDHLKSASDLGIPLLGVGLLYQEGYFEQRLNEAGWQQEIAARNDFNELPLELERGTDGEPITVELGFPEGVLVAQVWRAQVGRIPLYLLDANVADNTPDQRRVTQHLYGGDAEMRIRQELLLGIGGYRALERLGHRPTVWHMNEGHSAFLGLERIRRLMEEHDVTFEEAREAAAAELVFTTHTPVEAGHDYFAPDLLERYFAVYTKALGLAWGDFVGLGRQDPSNDAELFCMTVLALRLSARTNGVARLHGRVSREMWHGLWPELPRHEVPIGHVTNGVHLPSWIAADVGDLYEEYIGPGWRDDPANADWLRLDEVTDEDLWALHERRRHELVEYVRERARVQLERRGAPTSEVTKSQRMLDPEALTIGFARRFATYKRATLIARDRERLARIFSESARPVQLIIAGKAHPRDDAGKELIRQLVDLSREAPFRGRVVFLEDYGVATARQLVAGCDVWLNNPIRPREASGTSGMKASANGLLNLSTLDGWWDEAWHDLAGEGLTFGWAIGHGEPHGDPEVRDRFEAESLYDLLEHDVIPAFYERDEAGIPRSWVARMRAAIIELSPVFNTHRMLQEYTQRYYLPANHDRGALHRDGLHEARDLAAWRQRVTADWDGVAVGVDDGVAPGGEIAVGEPLRPEATVRLGGLEPEDVTVELYVGAVGSHGEIEVGRGHPMELIEERDGAYVYRSPGISLSRSGRYGFTVRVRPHHPLLPGGTVPHLVRWADDTS
jgi:glycogen phosphorylase